jgi:putative phosphoribosyl transferase
MSLPFRDRHDAGRQLGELMYSYAKRNAIVLGVPRGGVPVGYEVAHVLHAPLDVFLLRHMIAPGDPAVTIGCVASGGVRVLNHALVEELHIPDSVVDEITQRERISLIARERTYRGHNAALDLRNRTVLLVDDGSSAGDCLTECVGALREHEPDSIVLGLPLVPHPTYDDLRGLVDDLVYVAAAAPPILPERWYMEFTQISHTEVRALLSLSHAEAQSRELASSGD